MDRCIGGPKKRSREGGECNIEQQMPQHALLWNTLCDIAWCAQVAANVNSHCVVTEKGSKILQTIDTTTLKVFDDYIMWQRIKSTINVK